MAAPALQTGPTKALCNSQYLSRRVVQRHLASLQPHSPEGSPHLHPPSPWHSRPPPAPGRQIQSTKSQDVVTQSLEPQYHQLSQDHLPPLILGPADPLQRLLPLAVTHKSSGAASQPKPRSFQTNEKQRMQSICSLCRCPFPGKASTTGSALHKMAFPRWSARPLPAPGPAHPQVGPWGGQRRRTRPESRGTAVPPALPTGPSHQVTPLCARTGVRAGAPGEARTAPIPGCTLPEGWS